MMRQHSMTMQTPAILRARQQATSVWQGACVWVNMVLCHKNSWGMTASRDEQVDGCAAMHASCHFLMRCCTPSRTADLLTTGQLDHHTNIGTYLAVSILQECVELIVQHSDVTSAPGEGVVAPCHTCSYARLTDSGMLQCSISSKQQRVVLCCELSADSAFRNNNWVCCV